MLLLTIIGGSVKTTFSVIDITSTLEVGASIVGISISIRVYQIEIKASVKEV